MSIIGIIEHLINREPWQAEALCRQVDIGDVFFPEKGELNKSREAKQICAHCSVREPCLEYALAHQERHGVWGGYSERERRRMLKEIA